MQSLYDYGFSGWFLLAEQKLVNDTELTFGVSSLRALLFMLFLAVFVFTCGMAWRTLPGLRSLMSQSYLKQIAPKQSGVRPDINTESKFAQQREAQVSELDQLSTKNKPNNENAGNYPALGKSFSQTSEPIFLKSSIRDWIIFLTLSGLLVLITTCLLSSFLFIK